MIEVNSLCFNYNNKPVLSGVDLAFRQEEHVILSGPSGAGKTTLLRLIAGLEVPFRGTVSIDHVVMNQRNKLVPPHQRGIAVSFQMPALWPHMSVESHLRFVVKTRNKSCSEKRIARLLEKSELSPFAKRRPDQLSGGQAQRLSIVRALAAEPRFLLMDEPFSNLDARMRDKMVELVRIETADLGAGLLLVTHNEKDAEQLGSRCLRLEEGQLQQAKSLPV